MIAKQRNILSETQKARIALEATKELKTINAIAQEYGVHPAQVSAWKKQLQENMGNIFAGKRGPKVADASQDKDRLFNKIGQLNMEIDWLKKKLGIVP